MCGIAGFADALTREDAQAPRSASRPTRASCARMCGVIRHRGPDDEGVRVEPGVGLGMRRLSIIDLATGHQPIGSEDGAVQVVFNGEIYNFRELRASSRDAGHRFATTTDTEVIVHGYEQWGRGVFERLRGMFGIALWDSRARTLWLARDRAGIKPLYYVEHERPALLRLRAEVAARGGRRRARDRSAGARPLPRVPVHAARPRDLSWRAEAPAGPPPVLARRPRHRDRRSGRRRPTRWSGVDETRGRGDAARAACAMRCARTSSATSRSARSCRAASTRAWSWR